MVYSMKVYDVKERVDFLLRLVL